MSPASAVNELQQDLQLQTLARSFEALLLTIQHLGCKERDLHRRLEYAHDEVNYITHLHSCCQIPPPLWSQMTRKLALDQESLLRR